MADDWVVELLSPGAVEADVVVGPAGAEGFAAAGEFADEVAQLPVVGIAAGLGTQDRHDVVRRAFPVDEEVGRARVEEDEPGAVRRPRRTVNQRCVEGLAEAVGGEGFQPLSETPLRFPRSMRV